MKEGFEAKRARAQPVHRDAVADQKRVEVRGPRRDLDELTRRLAAAMGLALAGRPHLLVLDLMLPGLSGTVTASSGTDSPVSIDSSTLDRPSITTPSTGTAPETAVTLEPPRRHQDGEAHGAAGAVSISACRRLKSSGPSSRSRIFRPHISRYWL